MKLTSIRAFTEAGFVLIPLCSPTAAHEHMSDGVMKPCKTPGKVPTRRDWRESAPRQYHENELASGNYGVVLKAGDLIVDIDPRNFGWILDGQLVPVGTAGAVRDNPTARLCTKIGVKLQSFAVKTGGGGYHIYLRKPADTLVRNGLKDFPGIEFKSVGQQIAGPGCLHNSGKLYQVASGTIHEIADAPTSLLALISRTEVVFDDVGTNAYVTDAATQGRYTDYLSNQAPTSGSYIVACRGRDLGLPPALTLELMIEVWNKRRMAPRSPEELRVRVAHAYTYARGAVGTAHPTAHFDVIPAAASPSHTAGTAPKEADEVIAWKQTPQGAIVRCFHNLLNHLREPRFGLNRLFAYNEFSGRVEFESPAPWHRGRMPRYRGVGDDDFKLLKGHLASRHAYEASLQDIEAAITNVAYHNRFHPVREYLDGLKWDGKPRLNTWLRDFMGVREDAYSRACARKTLCAAVMRVYHPGVQFDHVLVLEGTQDLGKSSAIRILAGPWGADAPIDPHSRDTVDMMQGRWLIELAEMEVVRRTDEEALKAFITRPTDLARLAFGRTTREFPRQSVFIATKNPRADGTYLKDDTGNRRWWPVRCDPRHGLGQIDFKGLKDARDQLFAEAVVSVKTAPGEKLFMETAELKAAARTEAAARHAEHEWSERIASWLDLVNSKPETQRDFVTSRDVFVEAMGGSDRLFDRKSALAIAGVLYAMGWERSLSWINNRPVRGYERPGARERKESVDKLLAVL